ncbi:TetR/AcrR family transcriptional regulator [Bernardetia sp. ABR2-2B]|uniref:TetR/AcrR family transcriptional regulator n=1 Tax=Bernardetia sp. ABR2-2B TaxID=3127472 RepID=UPI0030CC000F
MTKNLTKENILISSFRVFLEKGYEKATLNELVKASKVSKGAFYHYFKGKEELFDATIEKYFFEIASPVVVFEPSKKHTFLENVQQYITKKNAEVMKVMQQLEVDFTINYMNVILEAMKLFEHHKKRSLKLLDAELDIHQKIIETAQQKGEVRNDMDAALLAKQFYFLLDGFKFHVLILADWNVEKYTEVNKLIEQFYQLIKIH